MLGFPGGSDGKESACNTGDLDLIPGLGRSPGEGMVTHSSILAWRIPWTQEPDGLQSMGSRLSTAQHSVLCQSQSSLSFSLLGIYKHAIHFKVFSVFPLKSLLNIPF